MVSLGKENGQAGERRKQCKTSSFEMECVSVSKRQVREVAGMAGGE